MLLHVEGAEPLGLVYEGSLLGLGQQLPLAAQPLADLAVVHLRVLLRHLAALAPGPHHERVHGSFHSIGVFTIVQVFGVCPLDVVVVGRRGRGAVLVGVVGEGGGGLGQLGVPVVGLVWVCRGVGGVVGVG